MTVKEAILEDLKPYQVRENLVAKKCLDFGLQPDDEYTPSMLTDTKRVQLDVLKQYAMLSSTTQGGSRIVYRGIRWRIIELTKELGLDLEGVLPTVKYLDL